MASMGPGKLTVVTRLVAIGTETATRSSSQACCTGCASRESTDRNNRLTLDFIFEVSNSGGKTSVQSHVGIADEAQSECKRERFVKNPLLEDAGANNLAGDGGQHF